MRDYKQEGQIGLERTPEEYVATMVQVFREVWRVLKPDGVCWLNIGDSYANDGKWGGSTGGLHVAKLRGHSSIGRLKRTTNLKPKDLCMIPARVALALQADGWWLRSDIIWAKPNPMPESVTDRPTRAHEYIFLLTKSERYYYDAAAIREPHKEVSRLRRLRARTGGKFLGDDGGQPNGNPHSITTGLDNSLHPDGANKRSVWTIATQPYPEAHYATFPEEIPDTCIRAGSRPGDLVLDPFFGSGTVGRVAERLSRRWVGLDLGYQDLQAKRVGNVQKHLVC